MKKTILILSSIILTGVAFEGCQKRGEGDPSISLHGRKGRLTGDWTLSAGTMTDVSGGTTSTTTISGTTATTTSGGTTTISTYSHTMSIVKDGTWSAKITESGTGYTYTQTSSGTWNWTGGVGELKNKSQFVQTTLSSTTMLTMGTSTTTDTDTWVGSDAPSTINDIYQLKNKEMIIKWNGTSASSSGGASSSSGEMTFVQ